MSDTQNEVGVLIVTRGGHTVRMMDDRSGDSFIQIFTQDQHRITLADHLDGHVGISIKDKTGGNFMDINSSDGSITLKCTGDLSLEATGNVSIKGMQVDVEAKTTGSFKATAEMEITGALVKIN